jgi:hypothetical protein
MPRGRTESGTAGDEDGDVGLDGGPRVRLDKT